MAGGVIGASLSVNFLALSRSGDVPARDSVVRIEVNGYPDVTAKSIEVNGMVVTPSAVAEALRLGEAKANARAVYLFNELKATGESARDLLEEAQRLLERDRMEGEARERAERILLRIRMREFGVEEPLVQKVGADRLVVELPGTRR